MIKFLFLSWFCTACVAIMFAMAIGTTISCSLGRRYRPVLGLSLSDVYDYYIYWLWSTFRDLDEIAEEFISEKIVKARNLESSQGPML